MRVFGVLGPRFVPEPWFLVALACVAASSRRDAAVVLRSAGFRWDGQPVLFGRADVIELALATPGRVCWCAVDEDGRERWTAGGRQSVLDEITARYGDGPRPYLG